MTKNVGQTDKIVRIVLAIILASLDFFEVVTGTFSWILSVVAIVLLVTAFINFCPAYTLLGMNTCKNPNTKS
jgi:heme/copper-type cytochrome/quinol oxidase subunit 4